MRRCAYCAELLPTQESGGPGRPWKWCSLKCRKAGRLAQHGQPCNACGILVIRGDVCGSCAGRRRRRWTPSRVLDALRRWAAINGEPPKQPDWTHSPEWPTFTTVVNLFGSWNAGIAAAGLEPRRKGWQS